MAFSAFVAVLGTLAGLVYSLRADLPANQTIVVAVTLLFLVVVAARCVAWLLGRYRR